MPRLTIIRLMGVIVAMALGLSMLARPTILAAAFMSASILSALTFAMIGIIIDRGARRAFWLGFFIAGWSYIVMDYWSDLPNLFNFWSLPDLITAMLDVIFNPTRPVTPASNPIPGGSPIVLEPTFISLPPESFPTSEPGLGPTDRNVIVFPRITHMLLAWTSATLGGLFGHWIKRTAIEGRISDER